MRVILAAAMICCPALADDLVYRDVAGNSVRLTAAPCRAPVLDLIPPAARALFRTGFAQIDGKNYDGCWVLLRTGKVFMQFDDGDSGEFFALRFNVEPGA